MMETVVEWAGETIRLVRKIEIQDGRLIVPSGLFDVLAEATGP